MKITAISGLLLASAASVVTAAPAKDETAERVSYSDQASSQPGRQDDWIELASPTPAKHGRTFVTVDDGAHFSHVRVVIHDGRPAVRSVKVVYADGKSRLVKLKHKPQVIALDGARAVDHIVIDADPRSRGTYTVIAAPQQRGGAVATR